MRKEINFKLNYRVKGKEHNIDLKVDFISNRIRNDYSKIITISQDVEKINNKINELSSEVLKEKIKKEDGYRDVVKTLKIEIDKHIDSLLDFNNNDFFKDRIDLLQRILIDNGYEDNDLIMSFLFWDEYVEPADLIEFMTLAIYKDIDKKKVLQIQ